MSAALLMLVAGQALPPVTQDEAVAFHDRGLCAMAKPGTGFSGSRGWIGTSLPGRTRLIGARLDTGEDTFNAVPGRSFFFIQREPGAVLSWCPIDARVPGRDQCGPVPAAFLYEVSK